MDRFRTVREAKEYLIHRILDEADGEGIPLSEIERNMLYFSETGWTLPDMMLICRKFDQTYDQGEYERKIGQIIRRIQEHIDSKHDNRIWEEAVRRLRDEDHYLLVLIDGAFSTSAKMSRWEIVRLLLAGIVVLAVFFPVLSFIESHVSNPEISGLIGEAVLLALALLAAFLFTRKRRGRVTTK